MAQAPGIHPSAYIGDGVHIGDNATIGPGAVLLGPLRIGKRVWIGPNCVIGTPPEIWTLPQNAAWTGDLDHAGVVIGDDVVIRDLSTVHQGSHRATTIGNGTWLLNSTYVAHDVLVGESVTLSAGVRLGGHVVIGDHANLGMSALVHQRRVIGGGAMVGMGTPVTADVLPFAKAFGSPARVRGVNFYALRKAKVSDAVTARLAEAYAMADPDLDQFLDDATLEPFIRSWQAHQPSRVMAPEALS